MSTHNHHVAWNKASFIFFSTALLLVQSPRLQADDLSATLSLTSDYVFRGVSLTNGPALQGSVDYAFDSGFYIGSWTSNYDYESARKTFGRFDSEIRLTDTDENQFGDREDLRVFVTVSTTFQ